MRRPCTVPLSLFTLLVLTDESLRRVCVWESHLLLLLSTSFSLYLWPHIFVSLSLLPRCFLPSPLFSLSLPLFWLTDGKWVYSSFAHVNEELFFLVCFAVPFFVRAAAVPDSLPSSFLLLFLQRKGVHSTESEVHMRPSLFSFFFPPR